MDCSLSMQLLQISAEIKIPGTNDRCLHVILPVAAFLEMLKLSLREQLLLPMLDVFSAGWL